MTFVRAMTGTFWHSGTQFKFIIWLIEFPDFGWAAG